ncbi:hypothetical protein TNCV_2484961 [Trichonephila clavipes]|uniref:Uncharacterized protein n=1 Tax=Trichonephila clavipes TaxID=2585209 RepID=A0A8X6W019_TRICX|nr:hypothetical protein TNCV_2484961 [Trichonephila clavipes]
MSSNLFLFKVSLSRGNKKKSGGLRSGEGCRRMPLHAFQLHFRVVPRTPSVILSDNADQGIWCRIHRFDKIS